MLAFKTCAEISIHTPREGSDELSYTMQNPSCYFNPHSPRGERLLFGLVYQKIIIFQSTLPARGATIFFQFSGIHKVISIHTPREGSDYLTYMSFC